jgi:uncharacterized protein
VDLIGEYHIPAPRQEVWAALNDVDVLKACIPGCDEMERVSEKEFAAKVTAKIGAVRAKLKGKVELSDIDAPNSYTLSGSGQGGVAGFAKGSAKVQLSDAPDGGTMLTYEADAELGGKLAAVGSRMVQGVANKMSADFFGAFARHLSAEAEEEPVPANQREKAVEKTQESEAYVFPDWFKSALVHSAITIIALVTIVLLAR